jgi:hypothetical protein
VLQQKCQKADKEKETLTKERTFAVERAERAEREMPEFVAHKNALLMQALLLSLYLPFPLFLFLFPLKYL